MTTLDVDAVKAFVTIADLQSFTRAAEALGTTQGAISVKLKRLEEQVGKRLIERTPRLVRLSAQGAVFLESARDFLAAHDRAVAGLSSVRRRFTLGIATHVGGPEVPTLLSRLSAHDPALTIGVRLNDSPDLLAAFDRGEIDAAIIDREDDRRDGEVLALEHFGWFATPDFMYRAGEPLRLAASSPSCRIRNIATRALDNAGISWTEVFLGCAPLPSPTQSLSAWPPRCCLAAWHPPARSRSVSGSVSLPSPHPNSSCFQHFQTQSLAPHFERLRRPFANTVHLHWRAARHKAERYLLPRLGRRSPVKNLAGRGSVTSKA
jgi:DNA-binding transcriptional LysR family regulator